VTFARVVAGVLLAGTLAACAGPGQPVQPPATDTSLPRSAPEPGERCPTDPRGEKVVFAAEDGVALAGARYGTGTRGLVLVHQRGSDLCGWSDAVPDLVAAGLRVLAIDLRCNGYSDCPEADTGDETGRDYAGDVGAAVAELRRGGATTVGVMGASLGAATAFVAAGRYPDRIDAVVGLSIFSASESVSTAVVGSASEAAARITAPVLICLSTGDAGSVQEGQADTLVAAGAAGAEGDVLVRPGSAHGWDLLRSPDVRSRVRAFLQAHL